MSLKHSVIARLVAISVLLGYSQAGFAKAVKFFTVSSNEYPIVKFSPDGKYLLTLDEKLQIGNIDLATGIALTSFYKAGFFLFPLHS